MIKPNIPENEEKRLSELNKYKIIDTVEDEDYDFLTQMAAEICETKIALISLITNDKQWFLSHHGLNARETSKEFSFCAHAINNTEDAFIIEDATKDERFYDNPLVTDSPNIIFYAGIPLVNKNGAAIGTICVIDDVPKKLSKKQLTHLKLLGKQTLKLLDLRKKTFEIEKQNKELNKISILFDNSQKTNKFGAWELDLKTGIVFWSDEVYNIHEVANDLVFEKSQTIEFYHPEDLKIIINAIENTIATGEDFDVECRLITAKNNFKWVRSSGKLWTENGEKIKLFGTFQDITKLKESEQKYQGIFNSTFSLIGLLDPNGIVLEANNTALKIADLKSEDVIGKHIWDCYWWQISEAAQKELRENFKKTLKGKEITYEVVIWTANQTPITILFSLRPVFNDEGKVIFVVPEGRPIQEIVDDRFRYKAVLEGTNIGTWEWNIQTGKKKHNEKWAEIIGYTLKELGPITNEKWISLIHPDDLIKSNEILNNCFLKKIEYYELETRMKHKNGSWVWVLDKGKVFSWTDKGKPFMMYGTHQDINQRKITEEQLRINEEIFRANFEYAAIGMALLNDKGEWLKVNKKLCKMLGYTEEEFLNLTFQEITHPKDLISSLNLVDELIEGKSEGNIIEKRYFHKNGDIVYVILGLSMVKDENGKILYFIAQIINITAQKTFETQLANTIAYNEAIMDASTQVAIIGTNTNGLITTFNEGAENLLGYKAEELIGKESPQFIHIKEEIEHVAETYLKETGEKIEGFELFVHNAKKGIGDTKEWTYKRKDGSTFPVLLSITAIKQKNKITGFLGIATDITEIKKAQKETLTLLEIADSQNDRLKNFAYIVSHNLRSHSVGISSLVELIEPEFPEFSKTEFFTYLKNSSNNLSETIKHLTEVVQINLTNNEKLKSIDLKPIVDNTISSLLTQAKKENITITNEINENLSVKAIPAYLDSIIMNFITNAIKYSSKERDSYLKIQTEKIDNYIILKFIDNGLGIDLKKHGKKLFGIYKTFHNHEDSRGIGLFITKNQIQAMNGKIEVESEVNVGTTFKIYLNHK